MKNKLVKLYIVALYLCSTMLLFADGSSPGSTDDNNAMEETNNDQTGAPIGNHLWVLAVVVAGYAFYKLMAAPSARIQD